MHRSQRQVATSVICEFFHYIGRKGWKMSGLTKAHGPLNSCIANSNLASHVENHVEPSWFVPLMSLWIGVLLEEWHQPIFICITSLLYN